ncbi:ABC transporter substrate-binding protein [Paracraurococcus ruber]|uniref:ABC transporter substrate-binding protein n=1 Tax=Paracraurococcus ruber TaxID=77675 RepID=A0ABS1CRQ6_9PROT|nr:ABC transporter substrate-binding protein [Paracraurococcus ruber]MBK1657128.1 ABC transporter substrate-binding protein [Paracraurococcus ruber]TDG31702.1 ABC transporter substrate-binding protein [Paracraurococcus ruber]
MNRRHFMQAGAAALALPSIARAQHATTLRFVPYADLAVLDPLTSSFMTRNHVMAVYDTLYALDARGRPQPQLVEGAAVEDDGKLWRLTLRQGPRFHDGTPVLARDAVASLRRWATRDSFGMSLLAVTEELSAPDDRTVQFRLKRPFPLLPDALAKPTNLMAAIMPERLAGTPPGQPLPEVVGSGPFRFVAEERVPGARNIYRKFDRYVPRPDGTPSFAAGPRIAHFDRVEWLTMPDPATQIAALQQGEVDWVEQPLMDLVPRLKRDRNLALQVVEDTGLIGFIRFNCLHPPFDNAAVRRVLLKAVRQREFMTAVVGPDAAAMNDRVGIFTPNMPSASEAGLEVMQGPVDLPTLKAELAAAGYKGERVVLLAATDVPRINAICEVTGATCRALGMNLDYVQTDWGTVTQRIPNRAPPGQGGWNIFLAYSGGYDLSSPATHSQIRGNGPNAWIGWPDAPRLEELRDAWLAEPDAARQKSLAGEIQQEAWRQAIYLPVGAYYQPVAYRKELTGMLTGLPIMWNIRRG